MGTVRLECPQCGRGGAVAADQADPPGTAAIKVECPDCADGDFFPVYEPAMRRWPILPLAMVGTALLGVALLYRL